MTRAGTSSKQLADKARYDGCSLLSFILTPYPYGGSSRRYSFSLVLPPRSHRCRHLGLPRMTHLVWTSRGVDPADICQVLPPLLICFVFLTHARHAAAVGVIESLPFFCFPHVARGSAGDGVPRVPGPLRRR
jgi:hypothetical protein